jgi:hypothetical protein
LVREGLVNPLVFDDWRSSRQRKQHLQYVISVEEAASIDKSPHSKEEEHSRKELCFPMCDLE